MRNPILDDPDVRVAKAAFLAEEVKNQRYIKEENKRKAEETRILEEKNAIAQRERNETLRNRLNIRYERPVGYTPLNSEQLGQANGEHRSTPFCADLDISSDEESPIIIRGDYEYFNFSDSKFRNVTFEGGNFRGCNFSNCTFEKTIFRNSTNFGEVDFRGSNFKDTTFRNSNLESAQMIECTFESVRFTEECIHKNVDFNSSIFKESVSIEFDRNHIQSIQFNSRRTDSWYKLTSPYSGISSFINVLLCGIYFGSLLAKLYFFKAIVVVHENTSVGPLNELLSEMNGISAIQFVFGDSWLAKSVAVSILVYQGLRYYLTLRLSPMIDDVRFGGKTPEWSVYSNYISIHQGVKFLGYLAIALFITDVAILLTQKI